MAAQMMPSTRMRRRPTSARRATLPDGIPMEPACRITVDQYHEMIRQGILVEGDPIELLEGWLVRKMPKSPIHVVTGKRLRKALEKILPRGWDIHLQDPITLESSEPEPDLAIVVENDTAYLNHHPTSKDTALVIEVADSSLSRDKSWKKRVYARSAIPQYWVVNLVDSVIEVFSDPGGSARSPDYQTHQVFSEKQRVPVHLSGKRVGSILVSDVLA